jgi:hypothetical protein
VSDGRARELLREAERRGLVRIEGRPGEHNRYVAIDASDATGDPPSSVRNGDDLRRGRFEMNAKRRALDEHYRR